MENCAIFSNHLILVLIQNIFKLVKDKEIMELSSFYIFPINSKPLGLTYADWSVKWWQWISSIPGNSNPAFDLTGEFVYNGQSISDVTFLCQTIEGKDNIPHRKCNLSSSSFFSCLLSIGYLFLE